ncbi:hypothetical protein TELCIR_15789 [Teladorsagia circumcincta]|uniref:G-protein coupled receptors family 1 profile domain-containing protein n=1 Tax=Teladorsagia circumcincta TaxID=45464 RepID=A0A2G9TZH9_TELCI|nr:hypothetical protein TELCIR_15789 [Teladorsagia circumcincta]
METTEGAQDSPMNRKISGMFCRGQNEYTGYRSFAEVRTFDRRQRIDKRSDQTQRCARRVLHDGGILRLCMRLLRDFGGECKLLPMLCRDGDLMKMPSYRLMLALGVFDVIQCVPHFVTGVFTIFQSVMHPALAKAMGVLATPAYVAYTVLTVVLSFNRFIQIYSPRFESILFTEQAVKYWIGLGAFMWLLFACALASPWATIKYLPDQYSWDYDYSLKSSWLVQKTEMYIELSTILVSAVFYVLVIIALYRTAFLPPNVWSYMVINMMWVLNSGVYPIIYFIVNRAIREKINPRRITVPNHTFITKYHNSEL